MFSNSLITKLSLSAAIAAAVILPACSIDAHDKQSGKNGEAHVDIKSPVGDLHVSEQVDIRDAGLTVYPGAKPAPKDDGDQDKKSANVDISIPGFKLKVVAAEFNSNDAPEKIIAYYDKELQKYGKAIQCKGSWSWRGGHQDVTGNEDNSKPVSCEGTGSGDSVELKVGTEGNQHIVAVKPHDKGTRFALVYVRTHTGKDESI